MRSHRRSPRSSLQTSLLECPDVSEEEEEEEEEEEAEEAGGSTHPPHTTSPGRVRNHCFAPTRDALHTPVSRHAPTSPLCSATRVQNSGRATRRSVARFFSFFFSYFLLFFSLFLSAFALSAFSCCPSDVTDPGTPSDCTGESGTPSSVVVVGAAMLGCFCLCGRIPCWGRELWVSLLFSPTKL
jgi:hypothetical protein